jgi:hypothetical protein
MVERILFHTAGGCGISLQHRNCQASVLRSAGKGVFGRHHPCGPRGRGNGTGARLKNTELARVGGPNDKSIPRKLYRDWKPGFDFLVIKANANNPSGSGGVANLKPQLTDGHTTAPTPSAGAVVRGAAFRDLEIEFAGVRRHRACGGILSKGNLSILHPSGRVAALALRWFQRASAMRLSPGS